MPRINRRSCCNFPAPAHGGGQRPRRDPRIRAGAGLCPGNALHWLKFVDFVPVSDQLLKGKLKEECQKALGISLTVETINGDGVQARITSAIQAKTGPDIMMAVNNWAQLYADSVADVSDIAEEVGKAQGGYFETAQAVANDGKSGSRCRSRSSACCSSTAPRGSPRKASRPEKFPTTWEDFRAAGKKLEGQKPAAWSDPGACVRRRAGRLVSRICGRGAARRSRPTARPSCSTARRRSSRSNSRPAIWKDALRRRRDVMGRRRQQPRLPLKHDQFHQQRRFDLSAGAQQARQLHVRNRQAAQGRLLPCAAAQGSGRPVQLSRAVLEPYPELWPNQKAAEDFLRWFHSKDVYDTWFTSQQGFSVGTTKMWENNKLWKVDPVMAPFRTAAESGRFAGYAGQAGRAAAETISKFIIVDMYAKAVQGMPADEAVKWAHSELVKIYA